MQNSKNLLSSSAAADPSAVSAQSSHDCPRCRPLCSRQYISPQVAHSTLRTTHVALSEPHAGHEVVKGSLLSARLLFSSAIVSAPRMSSRQSSCMTEVHAIPGHRTSTAPSPILPSAHACTHSLQNWVEWSLHPREACRNDSAPQHVHVCFASRGTAMPLIPCPEPPNLGVRERPRFLSVIGRGGELTPHIRVGGWVAGGWGGLSAMSKPIPRAS